MHEARRKGAERGGSCRPHGDAVLRQDPEDGAEPIGDGRGGYIVDKREVAGKRDARRFLPWRRPVAGEPPML